MTDSLEQDRKNQALLNFAAIGITAVILIGVVEQYMRFRDISTVMVMNAVHLFMVFVMWRRRSRLIALYFAGLAIYATVMTLRKDASPPPYQAFDFLSDFAIVVLGCMAFFATRRIQSGTTTRLIWKNVIILQVLAIFYSYLGGTLLKALLMYAVMRINLEMVLSRGINFAVLVGMVLIYVLTLRGWAPFTSGRSRTQPPLDPNPTVLPEAAMPRVRTRFLIDFLILTSAVSCAVWLLFISGTIHQWLNIEPPESSTLPPRSKNFPGCPSGSRDVTAWSTVSNVRWMEYCEEKNSSENIKNGPFMAWYQLDVNAMTGAYTRGQRSGLWRRWDAQGGKQSEGSYQNGRRVGVWSFWDSDNHAYTESYDTARADCGALWKSRPYLIVPGQCVGPIGLDSTPSALAQTFGTENFSSLGYGNSMKKTDPSMSMGLQKTKNAFFIQWDISGEPLMVTLSRTEHPDWSTQEKVKVGTSLKDLEKINGKPFKISVIGYSGYVSSWEGGRLTPQRDDLQVGIGPVIKGMSEEEGDEGDEGIGTEAPKSAFDEGIFSSTDPRFQKNHWEINTLKIFFSKEMMGRNPLSGQQSGSEPGRIFPTEDNTIVLLLKDGKLAALDAATGRQRWEEAVPGSGRYLQIFDFGSYLLWVNKFSELKALDKATGKTKWMRTLEGRMSFEKPVTAQGMLFILSQAKGSTLMAIDSTNGQVKWRFALGQAPMISKPVVSPQGLLLIPTFHEFIAIQMADGKKRWSSSVSKEKRSALVRVAGDAQHTYAVDQKGSIIAFDDRGTVIWTVLAPVPSVIDLTPATGVLLVSGYTRAFKDTQRRMVALKSSDGQKLWEEPMESFGFSSPEMRGNSIFMTGQTSKFRALNLQTGKEEWSAKVHDKSGFGRAPSPPLFMGDSVYIGDSMGAIYAYKIDAGQLKWRAETNVVSWPAFIKASADQKEVYVGTLEGQFYTFDAASGRKLAAVRYKSPFSFIPLAIKDHVAVLQTDFDLVGLDLNTGATVWKQSLKAVPNPTH